MWAKISPPILPDLIHRERLHRRLESCFRGCATWVGGPAGCGKTSIVASFVRQRQQPCLWYRVDEGDNDPGCSFQWLAAAAGRLATGVAGPELPALTPERVAGLPSFARTFVRALDERLPDSCVLVFDNVQEVDDDAFFYTLIRTALREFTPGKHVVLISRSTPHRLFATFSAARELSVVDWSDLRFTGEEARELVSLLLGRQDPAHADGLQAIADGWAAGLTLLSRCPRPLVEAADGATPRHPPVPGVLFDYFATEFLRSLDEPLQQFLLRTAFAPMLTPAMAQVLSGREDAEKLLRTLHQRNWLIVRREDHIHAYEYHPLFRQFLCDYTCATWRPTDVAELKRSTAAALEAAGDGEAAMDLFLDLQDWASVERILADCGPALAERARYRTLGLWLRRVPAEALRARPWLRYWMGVAEVPVSTAAALETFSDCYRAFRSSGMTDAAYAVWVTAADLLCNLNCYSSQLDFWLDEMAALQADGEEPSSDELSCRAAVCMHAGMSYRRPWHPDLAFWRDRALRLSQKLGRRDLQSLVYMHGLQEMACNASPDVGATADLMEKLLGGAKAPPVDQLRINFVKTALLMMEGQSERAISLARDCINYVDREGLVIHRPLLMYFQVRAYQNMGNVSAAALVISDFESYLSNLGTIFDTYFFVVKGIQDLLCGEFKQAAATLDLGVEMLGGDALTLAHFVTYFVRAQARSEAGQHEAAHADLAALFRMAECMGTPLQRHYCLLMAARLAENRGDRDAALVALRDGLALAADAPLCYFLVWRPATLAHLMALALENGIEPEAAHKIIRERKLAPPRPLRPLDPWPRRYRVRMFGPFSLTRDGVCIAKAQSAKLALLQSLIWHGGRNVSIGKIVDDVWPEKDGDRAENTLQVTLLRLRELLGEKNAISVVNRTISLDPSLWGPDLEKFRSLIALLQEELAQARSCDKKSRITFLQDRLLAVYGGDLLVDAGDALWIRSARRKTRETFIRMLIQLQSFWERAGEAERADLCRRRARAAESADD